MDMISIAKITIMILLTDTTADDSPAGFSAFVEIDQEYAPFEVIQFTNTISNFGDWFSNSTFTCPYSGVYLFSLTYNTFYGNPSHLEIWRDGEALAGSLADHVGYEYTFGSVVTVAECAAGQVVLVNSGPYSAYAHGTSRRSVFSGYLLYRN